MTTEDLVKPMLSWTLLRNPFFILFTRDGCHVDRLNLFSLCEVELDSTEDSIFKIRSNRKAPTDEEVFKPKPAHYKKRVAMFNVFEDSDSKFKPESYPIGKITFILSVLSRQVLTSDKPSMNGIKVPFRSLHSSC